MIVVDRYVTLLLDTVYRIDVPSHQWHETAAEHVFRARGSGQGTVSYEFDASAPDASVRLGAMGKAGDATVCLAHMGDFHANVTGAAYCDFIGFGTSCRTTVERLSSAGTLLYDPALLYSHFAELRIEDVWTLSILEPEGRGVALAQPLVRYESMSSAERRRWCRIGDHIAAGYRLRRRLAGRNPLDYAHAVFSPDGREVHVSPQAVGRREALRRAVRELDRARGADFRNAGASVLEVWQGVLEGRWSLLDHVDSDGKHFIVIVENAPAPRGSTTLSRREREVATLAAQRLANKEIAYELGISLGSVATHLRRALGKLSLASRSQLLALHGSLAAALGPQALESRCPRP